MPSVPSPSDQSPGSLIASVVARYPAHPAFHDLTRIRQDQPDASLRLREVLVAFPELVERMVSAGRGVTTARDRLGHTVGEGIELLGFRAVHATAMLTCVVRAFEGDTNQLDAITFWRRAALAGAIGGAIGVQAGGGLDEQAGIGGLVVYLGWLALDQSGAEYLSRLDEGAAGRLPTEADEVVAFGFTLRDLTAAILREWGMPEGITRAAADASAGIDSSRLAAVIMRGVEAADAILAGEEPEPVVALGIRGRVGSTQALLTRVDALLAGVMLQ